jgi:Xaa-Pro aminopeptidase
MSSRIKKLRLKLAQDKLDGLLLACAANISYLTDYTSRDSYFLVARHENIYFTDFRYCAEARAGLKGKASVQKIEGSLFETVAKTCRKLGIKRLGFEERYLSYAHFRQLEKAAKKKIWLVATSGLVEGLREVKDSQELINIRRATAIAVDSLNFIKKFIKPGRTELEVAGELERYIRLHGGQAASFDIIVASGPNSSYPHHITSSRKLRKGEPVLIDMGVECRGYKSDLTRVFFLGKINLLARRVYDIVLSAQKEALKAIKPGVLAKEVDSASRNLISQKGYASCFGHSLGHGVGREVHEGPRISGKEEKLLLPGMCFTVEPAIYLPGKLGIRIEDMVLVTKKGCEVLSGSLNK